MKKILSILAVSCITSTIGLSSTVSCSSDIKGTVDVTKDLPDGAASMQWFGVEGYKDKWNNFDYVGDNYTHDFRDIAWWTKAVSGYTKGWNQYKDDQSHIDPNGKDNGDTIWNKKDGAWLSLIPYGWFYCEKTHSELIVNLQQLDEQYEKQLLEIDDAKHSKYLPNDFKTLWRDAEKAKREKSNILEESKTKEYYDKVYSLVKDFGNTIFDINKNNGMGSSKNGYWRTKAWYLTKAKNALNSDETKKEINNTNVPVADISDGLDIWSANTLSFDKNIKTFIDAYKIFYPE